MAVEPTTGKSVMLVLPHTDSHCFQRFLEELRRAVPDEPVGVVLDGSSSHTSGAVQWPAGLPRLPLPPYSPELNPAERWFEAVRRPLANRIFDTLDDLEHALTEALQPYWNDPTQLIRLTAYPWWRDAVLAAAQNITAL